MLVDAMTLILILVPLPFKDIFVGVDHLASSFAPVIDPVTLILTAICVEHVHVCVRHDILLPDGTQLVSILVGQCTLAISQSFDEQTFE